MSDFKELHLPQYALVDKVWRVKAVRNDTPSVRLYLSNEPTPRIVDFFSITKPAIGFDSSVAAINAMRRYYENHDKVCPLLEPTSVKPLTIIKSDLCLNVWRAWYDSGGESVTSSYLLNDGSYELGDFFEIPDPAFDFKSEQAVAKAITRYYTNYENEYNRYVNYKTTDVVAQQGEANIVLSSGISITIDGDVTTITTPAGISITINSEKENS